MSSPKRKEVNQVGTLADITNRKKPERPNIAQMDYREAREDYLEAATPESIVKKTSKEISDALDKTLLGTPKVEMKNNENIEEEKTSTKKSKKKSRKIKYSSEEDTITLNFNMAVGLNYELMARTKNRDLRQHKITKAELITVACRYFLDTYEAENPEDGLDKEFLELVGKA